MTTPAKFLHEATIPELRARIAELVEEEERQRSWASLVRRIRVCASGGEARDILMFPQDARMLLDALGNPGGDR